MNGYLQGPAEVVVRSNAKEGGKIVSKFFGWFENGYQTGVQVWLMQKFPFVFFYDKDSKQQWAFFQSAWPRPGVTQMGNSNLIWGELESLGKPFSHPGMTENGKTYSNLIRTDKLLQGAALHALMADVPSVGAAALESYLYSVSLDDPTQSVQQLVVNPALFPSDPPAMANHLNLQPDELLVRTREGCALVSQYIAAPKYRQGFIERHLRHSWLGECVDGLTLGPGKLLIRNDDNKLTGIRNEWHFYGKPIGRTAFIYLPSQDWSGSVTEGFIWDNTSYNRSLSAQGNVRPQPENRNPPTVSVFSPERKRIYKLLRSEGRWNTCGAEGSLCLSETPSPFIYNSSVNQLSPCTSNCDALWTEKIAPILAEMAAFQAQHAPEVEAVQQSVAPLLQSLQRQRVQEGKRKEQEWAAAAAKQKAEAATVRKQELAQANQTRKPVSTPVLDQLIMKILTGAR